MTELARFIASDFNEAKSILAEARFNHIEGKGIEVLNSSAEGGWEIGCHHEAAHCEESGLMFVSGRVGVVAIVPAAENRAVTRALLIGYKPEDFAHLQPTEFVKEWIGMQCS